MLAAEIVTHSRQPEKATYYARVDVASVDLVRHLTQAGFYVVDVNVTLALETERITPRARCGLCTIQEATPELAVPVLDIARTCFRLSRFHLDPLVAPETADQVKHDWVQSYLAGNRGERLFIALEGGRPVGFLAVMATCSDGREARIIDLIGVASSSQRQGVGRALVHYFLDYSKGRCDVVKVGTQAANSASLRLYQGCGFSIQHCAYVMHMHVGAASKGAFSRRCA